MAYLTFKYGSFDTSLNNQPVPDISLNTSFNLTQAGSTIGSTVNLTINGLLVASGELNSRSNANATQTAPPTSFSNLLGLISGFRAAFSKDYQELSLKCKNSNSNLLPDQFSSGNIKVANFNINANNNDPNMLFSAQYSAELIIEQTGMKYILDNAYYVSSIQNSYSIENLDTLSYYGHIGNTINMYPRLSGAYLPTYRITRTLGATGKDTKDGALFNAKRCVSGLIANDIAYTGVLYNLSVFERNTSIELSEIDGTYTITDTCTAISGTGAPSYTENFTINHSMDENLKRTATINGTIQGLGSGWTNSWDHLKPSTLDNMSGFYKAPAQSKYLSASGAFENIKSLLYGRILATTFPSGINSFTPHQYVRHASFPNYTGLFNPIPASISVEHDLNRGAITYNYSYDTRPVNLISGSLSESLTVEDTYGVRSYAQLPILYARPIFQDLGTSSSFSRTASYEAQFPSQQRATSNTNASTIDDILNQFDPKKMEPSTQTSNTINGIDSKLTKDDTDLDVINGKYRRSKTWLYQKKIT